MDLKQYFHKIRAIEATIPGEHAIIVSLESPDGARAGQYGEATRQVAATLVAQGKARLATEEESESYREGLRAAKKAAEEQALRNRVQFTMIPEAEIAMLRKAVRVRE